MEMSYVLEMGSHCKHVTESEHDLQDERVLVQATHTLYTVSK